MEVPSGTTYTSATGFGSDPIAWSTTTSCWTCGYIRTATAGYWDEDELRLATEAGLIEMDAADRVRRTAEDVLRRIDTITADFDALLDSRGIAHHAG